MFPAGEVREPFVDVRDIADVVVAAVTAGDRLRGAGAHGVRAAAADLRGGGRGDLPRRRGGR
ncbi:hypothetical protein ACRAWF_47395 [Streptomyces sp. L7]